jgi:hypothetical protein
VGLLCGCWDGGEGRQHSSSRAATQRQHGDSKQQQHGAGAGWCGGLLLAVWAAPLQWRQLHAAAGAEGLQGQLLLQDWRVVQAVRGLVLPPHATRMVQAG